MNLRSGDLGQPLQEVGSIPFYDARLLTHGWLKGSWLVLAMLVMVMVIHSYRGCTVIFIANHGCWPSENREGTIMKPSCLQGDNSETELPAAMMLIVMMCHYRHHHHHHRP